MRQEECSVAGAAFFDPRVHQDTHSLQNVPLTGSTSPTRTKGPEGQKRGLIENMLPRARKAQWHQEGYVERPIREADREKRRFKSKCAT